MNREQTRRGERRRNDGRTQAGPTLTEEEVQKILRGDPVTIDEVAEQFAQSLRDLNRSQMRNFYNPFTRIRAMRSQEERKKALIRHRARIAYLVARQGEGSANRAKPIWDLFGDLIKKATDDSQIDALCDLAEALIAYHRRESSRSEEHTSELQSHSDLHSFPTRRSSDLGPFRRPHKKGHRRLPDRRSVRPGRSPDRLPPPRIQRQRHARQAARGGVRRWQRSSKLHGLRTKF